jgi:hypothetical protein
MSIHFDAIAARQRHADLLREAEHRRLVRALAKANGAESLFSRMVKLLSRSSRPVKQLGRSDESLHQHQLADQPSR